MKKKKHLYKILLWIVILASVAVISTVIGITAYASSRIDFSADEALFNAAKCGRETKFFYNSTSDSSDLLNYQPIEFASVSASCEKKEWYSYSEISQYLKDGFVAAEDRGFFKHHGVDLKRTIGALVNTFTKSRSSFGGSTITQQVIKNISGDNERTVKRKLNEIIRAYHIEYSHTKEEIFELYMNIVPMGENMIGVGIASNRFFGKNPSELTAAEAATLVGITNAPARYNPYKNPEACVKKRNVILGAMKSLGFIDDEEYGDAISEELELIEWNSETSEISSWFTESVIDELCDDLMVEKGYSREAARMLIYNGGLSVYTTLDPEIQALIEEYFENLDNFPDEAESGLQFSMVITDNKSNLKAIVGSLGKKQANRIINYATVNRAPGSTLKPIALYAPLIDEGRINWASVFDDVPISFTEKSDGSLSEYPKNSPNVYSGLTTVSDAISYSKNTVAVRLYEMLGAEKIYANLKNNFRFKSIIRKIKTENGRIMSDLSAAPLALGQLTYGVPLRTLTEAYTVFPSEGKLSKSRSYIQVLDSEGKTLIKKDSFSERIFSEKTARIMNQALSLVCQKGTASAITLYRTVDTAGKTGTSGGSRDRLFIGYTPYYTAGIWCGFGDNSGSAASIRSDHITIWDNIMKEIHEIKLEKEEALKSFSTEGLKYLPYCKDSGKLFSPECLRDPRDCRLEYGYFSESIPNGKCDRHKLVKYDVLSEGVAVGNCPHDMIKIIALLDIPERSFPKEVIIQDAEYVYREMGEDDLPADSYDIPYFYYTLPVGEYVGRSKNKKQFNSACYIHCE